jgi:hypothetical protein
MKQERLEKVRDAAVFPYQILDTINKKWRKSQKIVGQRIGACYATAFSGMRSTGILNAATPNPGESP